MPGISQEWHDNTNKQNKPDGKLKSNYVSNYIEVKIIRQDKKRNYKLFIIQHFKY